MLILRHENLIGSHKKAKEIATEIIEKKKDKSYLKQLDEVAFQAVTRLPVGVLIPTLI